MSTQRNAALRETPQPENRRLVRVVDAIAEACAQEMRRDEKVFVFGLDVDDHKSIQGSTAGLLKEFGPQRLFGTPLSEDAMTGIAVGAAMAGKTVHVSVVGDHNSARSTPDATSAGAVVEPPPVASTVPSGSTVSEW